MKRICRMSSSCGKWKHMHDVFDDDEEEQEQEEEEDDDDDDE